LKNRRLSSFGIVYATCFLTAWMSLGTAAQASGTTRYFVGVCSCVYDSTSYRTQFELVNEQSQPISGSLAFYRADGNPDSPAYEVMWVGESGTVETVDGVLHFTVPQHSELVVLTVPSPDGGLGWARLETDGDLSIQAALQTARTNNTKVAGDFNQYIQYQAELHSVKAAKKVVFPISLYAGMKHLSTAFTVVNLSGSRAKVILTFRPDVVREVELGPGELLADYFERFWPLSFPAVYPLQLRGIAEVSSDAPLAVGVFRTINGFPDLGIGVSALPVASGEAADVDPGAEFELRVGESVRIRDTDARIELWDLSEDSRCPVDVVCVWEGRAVIELRLSSGGEPARSARLSTETDKNSVEFAGYRISLVGVDPDPVSTDPPELSDYRARLVVSLLE